MEGKLEKNNIDNFLHLKLNEQELSKIKRKEVKKYKLSLVSYFRYHNFKYFIKEDQMLVNQVC